MKYAVEMGSVAMIYIPSFIKTGSKAVGARGVHIQTEKLSHKPNFIFFKKKKKVG
jgi:hypothetical protein